MRLITIEQFTYLTKNSVTQRNRTRTRRYATGHELTMPCLMTIVLMILLFPECVVSVLIETLLSVLSTYIYACYVCIYVCTFELEAI